MKIWKTQEKSDENRLGKILGEYQNEDLEQELKDSRYYPLISQVQRLIHREIPPEARQKILAVMEKGIIKKNAAL